MAESAAPGGPPTASLMKRPRRVDHPAQLHGVSPPRVHLHTSDAAPGGEELMCDAPLNTLLPLRDAWVATKRVLHRRVSLGI